MSELEGTANIARADGDETPAFGFPIERAWNVDSDRSDASMGSIRDNHLFVSFNPTATVEADSEVARVNRFTGDLEWSKNTSDYVLNPRETDGNLYMDGDDSIQCWDASTGEERWRQRLSGDLVVQTGLSDGHVFAVGFDISSELHEGQYVQQVTGSTLYALGLDDGELKWRQHSDHGFWSLSHVDGQLFVRESDCHFTDDELFYEDGRLVALDAMTGDREWSSDWINPRFFHENDGTILTLTEADDLFGFSADGRRLWEQENAGDDYYVTDEHVIVSRSDGGITVFDHTGSAITSDPRYPSETVTMIRSGPTPDLLLLGTPDELIAIDGEEFTERWRTSVPAAPESITARREVVFVAADSTVYAFDVETGERVWENGIVGVDRLSIDMRDGFLYVSGDGAPLRAYSGRRGRAMTALERAKQADETISGTIAGLLGWRDYVSQAETAIEEGQYEKADSLLVEAERRRQAVRGALGLAGVGTAYGTTRVGAGSWHRRRLASVAERLESRYPIERGELEGAEPTELLAQVTTVRDSIGTVRGPKLRAVFSDDYADLLSRADRIADLHSELVEASVTLGDINRTRVPAAWVSDLRDAVDAGDVDRIESLLDRVSTAETLFERVASLERTIADASLTAAADDLTVLLDRELGDPDGAIEEVSLETALRSLEEGITAYESYRRSLRTFDLDPFGSTLEELLRQPSEITAEAIDRVGEYDALFSAAASVEEQLESVEFDAIDASRATYTHRARTCFANRDASGLRSLASELHDLQAGRWSHSDLFSVSPVEFEYLVAALFADMGYEVVVTDAQGDKGIDVIARNPREVLAIQVKQYSSGNSVGRPTVQQMIGAMAQAGADKAVIVSSAGFTQTAREASRDLGTAIELVDGAQLVQLLTDSSLHPSGDASYYRSRAAKGGRANHSWSNTSKNGSQTVDEEGAYRVLGIEPPATADEIKSQYRELVKEAHPDAGGTAAEFKRIQEAYTTLVGNDRTSFSGQLR
ncbi:restriction endonuclease [Natronorubrum sp. FCH18a]|uniref:restriction endonuclease n=1 Tax=Natronorubrum sp. FCH18a TaxID=3447018 RepID=UPI003F513010